MRNEFGSWTAVEALEHHKKVMSNNKSSEVEIFLPELEDWSQTAKEKLVEFVKSYTHEFGLSLSILSADEGGPQKIRTYSNREKHKSV